MPDHISPVLSVVIPTCDRPDDLRACLASIERARRGIDASQIECIVTDDGRRSLADSLVGSEFSWAKWVAGPRRGPAANRNFGAKCATGAWVAFIDDDCTAGADWLRGLLSYTAQRDLDVIEGKTIIPNRRPHPFYHGVENLEGGCFWSCNLAVRREQYVRLGGFDEDFLEAASEDVEFAWRIREQGLRTVFAAQAIVEHPQRFHGLKGFLRRVPRLKWSLLAYQKTGAAPPEKAGTAQIAWKVMHRHCWQLMRLVRDAIFGTGERGPAVLNLLLNWLVLPYQLPHLLWWEFKFRRLATISSRTKTSASRERIGRYS